jgi:hypothetical protein
VDSQEIEEELRVLDFKLGQLKRDYDQYFLGTRPREPVLLRGEVNKSIIKFTNTPLKNTAMRFKFSSICSRFQAFRRQWDETLRKIEDGTYERHRFKAKLHKQPAEGGSSGRSAGENRASEPDDLYQSYVDARLACGESVKGLSRDKLERVIEKQSADLRKKFGDDARFRFRVAVEDGKVRLKATRAKS